MNPPRLTHFAGRFHFKETHHGPSQQAREKGRAQERRQEVRQVVPPRPHTFAARGASWRTTAVTVPSTAASPAISPNSAAATRNFPSPATCARRTWSRAPRRRPRSRRIKRSNEWHPGHYRRRLRERKPRHPERHLLLVRRPRRHSPHRGCSKEPKWRFNSYLPPERSRK